MATETRKILGQSNPAATSLTDVYTVPALTQAVVSSIVVANHGAMDATFRVSVAVNAAADDPKQYLYYDVEVFGNDTFAATLGIALGANDKVRVYASTATMSFNIFGVEIA